MFIRPSVNFSGRYNCEYLKSRVLRRGFRLYFTRLDNELVAIVTPDSIENPRPLIVYDDEVKVPLWKQSMQMQMGRKPTQTTTRRDSKSVRWISEEEINPTMRFAVYDFVSL